MILSYASVKIWGKMTRVGDLKEGHQILWYQSLVKGLGCVQNKRFASVPNKITRKGMCYKKNPSVEMDFTYPTVKLVTTSLVAQHKAKATYTLYGPMSKAVKRGRRRGKGLACNPS